MQAATGALGARTNRIELAVALGIAVSLVVARSLVHLIYPHSAFDSDQAIFGLMTKHLIEGRAFPLFMYGQDYLLAVEAWFNVPFFLVMGATVAALRASIITLNLLVVVLLIIAMVRDGGLRPYAALAAATFFAFPPPDTSANLLDAGGVAIEPFLWVLLLWFMRRRPFWFGSLLGAAFLNREFSIYVVPVILAGQLWTGALVRIDTWRRWLFALVAFLAVWQGIEALRPLADPNGPGTHVRSAAVESSQIANLRERMRVDVAAMPAAAGVLLDGYVLRFIGGQPLPSTLGEQGYAWLGWVLRALAIAAVIRLAWIVFDRSVPLSAAATGWFLLGVGLMSVVGYALTRPVDIVTPRYLMLSLYIPVGLTAVWLALEPRRFVRTAVVALVIGWAAVSAVDNWRHFAKYQSGQVPDGMAELIAALDARGITIAEASYWRAYKLTFLTQERIIVASTDKVRVSEYRQKASAQGDRLVRLQEAPCAGEAPVAGLYICEPR